MGASKRYFDERPGRDQYGLKDDRDDGPSNGSSIITGYAVHGKAREHFVGHLMIDKTHQVWTWSIRVGMPSQTLRKLAFDCQAILIESEDGSGEALGSFDGTDVLLRGTGPWTAATH